MVLSKATDMGKCSHTIQRQAGKYQGKIATKLAAGSEDDAFVLLSQDDVCVDLV